MPLAVIRRFLSASNKQVDALPITRHNFHGEWTTPSRSYQPTRRHRPRLFFASPNSRLHREVRGSCAERGGVALVGRAVHAYTRIYADAQPSSRTKDLVDLVLISELANLDATSLQRAIQETFTVRGTHPVPEALPPPPQYWSAPLGELARTVGIPTDLAAGLAAAAELLDPILNGRLPNGTWDVEKRQWAQG